MSRSVFNLPGLTFLPLRSVTKSSRGPFSMSSIALKGAPTRNAFQRDNIATFAFIQLEAQTSLAQTQRPNIAAHRAISQSASSVEETAGTIISAIPVSRISGIERLGSHRPDRLMGTNESDVLIGKSGDDRLIGDAGNDQITGGQGRDWLQGGTGFDRFFFNQSQEGIDDIDDFSVIFDWLVVSAKGFKGGLQPGSPIDRQQFHRGAAAADRSDRFIYHPSTGSLSFDPDGTGPEKSIEFAQLSRNLALTSANIHVVS